ncbi:hypothetical protein PtA15_3A727 [Puccinia triticina]|uniref:Uncharacterized protein n=1 Tax=Puccinia triticina TaxID=208348 RepID=A0ABY7CHC5_9BASI|nr:uncharacterized protein PtA15_3A727 [Puccinia triticina]WAQ83357.1 hypothetical protein PtA15_3A727 [Puccinia triticina]
MSIIFPHFQFKNRTLFLRMNTRHTVSSRNFLFLAFFFLIVSNSVFTFRTKNSQTNTRLQLRSMVPETRMPIAANRRLTKRTFGPKPDTPGPKPDSPLKDGLPPKGSLPSGDLDLGLSGDKDKGPPPKSGSPGKDSGKPLDLGAPLPKPGPPKSGPPSKLGPLPKPGPLLGSESSEISGNVETKTIRIGGGKDCDKKKKINKNPPEKSTDDSQLEISGPTVIKIEVVSGGCSTCCKTCTEDKLKEATDSPPPKKKTPDEPIPEISSGKGGEPNKPKPIPEISSGKGGAQLYWHQSSSGKTKDTLPTSHNHKSFF